jgi:hypothetical protein
MNRALASLGPLAAVGGAALLIVQVLRLSHLNATCGDSRSGGCHALDHPYGVLSLVAVALFIVAWVLLDFANPIRRKLVDLFVGTTLALQVLWLVGLVGFRARYHHPHAGGRTCFDECFGAVFNYWGWVALELALLPISLIALAILSDRVRRLVKPT